MGNIIIIGGLCLYKTRALWVIFFGSRTPIMSRQHYSKVLYRKRKFSTLASDRFACQLNEGCKGGLNSKGSAMAMAFLNVGTVFLLSSSTITILP